MDADLVAEIVNRAGGLCEIGGPPHKGVHVHHRRLRAQLGRDSLDNCRLVCFDHHRQIHDQPGMAYAKGWLVKSWNEPGEIEWLPL